MKIISCNIRGRKHQKFDAPCEDGFYILQDEDVVTVSVADGAGSDKYPDAKAGADVVSKAICEFFSKKFDDFFSAVNEIELRKVVHAVCIKALKEKAESLGLDSYETMASTLMVVSVKGNRVVACQIGDGLIGTRNSNGCEMTFIPQNGEFANATYFLTIPDAWQMIQVKKFYLNDTSHIFLMTDGISDSVCNDANGRFTPVMDKLCALTSSPDGSQRLSDVIEQNIVNANSMSDDSTMVIVGINDIEGEEEVEPSVPVGAPVVPNFQAAPALKYEEDFVTAIPQNEINAIAKDSNEDNNAKSNNKWVIIIALLLVVVVAACIVLGVALKKKNDKGDGKSKEKQNGTSVSEMHGKKPTETEMGSVSVIDKPGAPEEVGETSTNTDTASTGTSTTGTSTTDTSTTDTSTADTSTATATTADTDTAAKKIIGIF